MVRSHSYDVATRSLPNASNAIRTRYASFNKFISLNENPEIEDVSVATDPKKANSWPAQLEALAVKDNITTSDLPTTCGSSTLKSHVSPFEATVVKILRSQGSRVQGKTNLDEFGMGSHSINSFFGPVTKDSTPRRSVGGSSGGSAISVAQNISQFALGTDTGGSVRLPAAYTGVVGFKPSYGLISRKGVIPYANSLDTVGLLAPDTRHLHGILRKVGQHDAQDPTSVTSTAWERTHVQFESAGFDNDTDLAKLTIGFPVEYNIEELEPAIRQAWMDTLSTLRKKGCKIVPVSLPSTKHALSAYYVLAPAEAASNLSKYDGVRYGTREVSEDGDGHVLYSETRGEGFGAEVKRRILLGSYTLSATAIDNYFGKAQKVRRLVQRDFDRVFKRENPLLPPQQFDISDMHESIPLQDKLGPSQVDFLLCPTAPTLPPYFGDAFNQKGVDSYMNDVFTVPASLAGLPAISIPCRIPGEFWDANEPKVAGIQIIGQYGEDFRLLALARRLEHILDSEATPPSKNESKVKRTHQTRYARAVKATKRLVNSRSAGRNQRALTPQGPRIIKVLDKLVVRKHLAYNSNSPLKEIKSQEISRKLRIRRTTGKPQTNYVNRNFIYSPRGSVGRDTLRVRRLTRRLSVRKIEGYPAARREDRELLRKHVSKKGEYHRKTLTDGEANKMLDISFDEWLGNSGVNTALSDLERKSASSLVLEDPKRVAQQKSGVKPPYSGENVAFEDFDNIDEDVGAPVSWEEALRASKKSARNADEGSNLPRRNDDHPEDFLKSNTSQQKESEAAEDKTKGQSKSDSVTWAPLDRATSEEKWKKLLESVDRQTESDVIPVSFDRNTPSQTKDDAAQEKPKDHSKGENVPYTPLGNPTSPPTPKNTQTTQDNWTKLLESVEDQMESDAVTPISQKNSPHRSTKGRKHPLASKKRMGIEQDENLTFPQNMDGSAGKDQDKGAGGENGSLKSDGDDAKAVDGKTWWNPFK